MNILNEHYNPHNFHVNTIQTVLVRLDGSLLRISRPEHSLLKHAFHTDPTLTEAEPRIISQNIYDLTNAKVLVLMFYIVYFIDFKVKLRPRRLAKRRWFSRKYPICIHLAASSQEQSLSRRDTPNQRHVISKSNTPTYESTTHSRDQLNTENYFQNNNSGVSNEELAQEADSIIFDMSSSSEDCEIFLYKIKNFTYKCRC